MRTSSLKSSPYFGELSPAFMGMGDMVIQADLTDCLRVLIIINIIKTPFVEHLLHVRPCARRLLELLYSVTNPIKFLRCRN